MWAGYQGRMYASIKKTPALCNNKSHGIGWDRLIMCEISMLIACSFTLILEQYDSLWFSYPWVGWEGSYIAMHV